jgi:tetratricopeptide (TPR) repeat protein
VQGGSFLDSPAPALAATVDEPMAERPGTVIGPYKLLEQIGEGGFGVVYMAEQTQPIRRMVALKIIKPGMDTAQVIARFESERQALALMDHPHIAKVLDAGATASGRPYFVMELVKGVPITDFCDKNHLPPEARMRLFIDICLAIQHAHHKGVIHRDIKPSNVMVTQHEGMPMAKVIDFGVAKALGQKLTDRTLFTSCGQMIGTLAYMSPEQAAGKSHQADRRSDVYSLGVILCEMLTGELPFRGSKMMLLHQVLREEPRAPRKVNGKIPRDLETICLKALAKAPGQRYGMARALAEDVRSYLKGEPIKARPVGVWERGWRWAQRRPAVAGLLLVSALALLALVGAAVAVVAFRTTEKARQETDSARAEADAQRAEADKQRAEAQEQRREAEKQRMLAQRYLYASDMNLADRAWQEAHIARMLDLLERHRSERASKEDLRGFEWHYLWRLCHSELLTLKGHTNGVTSVAFSPDGRRLASASWDQTVKVWDACTGQVTLTLQGHTGPVSGVAFSPDGQRLAGASYDQTVKVWDASTGQEVLTLKGHTSAVGSVAFSPDAQRLASASHDGTVKVWDAGTGQETLTLKGHMEGVFGVAFSPDGKQLAAASFDNTVKVWEAAKLGDEERLKRQAVLLVRDLFEKLDFQADVRTHLRQDRFLGEAMRSEAIALAAKQCPNPERLNQVSWAVVSKADTPIAARERALRQAREACRIEPENGLYLNTLGVALYRTGQFQAALERLTRSERLNAARNEGSIPRDLAFLAMTHYQLGQNDSARKMLDRLHQAAKAPPWVYSLQSQAFLQETEKLLQRPPDALRK